jgi:hypothetical protein
MYWRVLLFFSILIIVSCGTKNDEENVISNLEDSAATTVQRIDTLDLIILYPNFSAIDLVCGTMPSKSDSSVICVAEAAYTGECLKEFKHSNIAGDHVSGGVRYKGYKCKRNTGAFVFYNKRWKFCYQQYSSELDAAEKHGGMGFGQEMLIFNGKLTPSARKDANNNQFRALCCIKGRLCVIESNAVCRFADFKDRLLRCGVSDALYLDMGYGWNHAWYRDKSRVVVLHPKLHPFCTNWVTFYR